MNMDNSRPRELGILSKLSEILDLPQMIDTYNEKIWPIIRLAQLKKLNYWVMGREANIKNGQKVLEVGSGRDIEYKALAGEVGQDGVYVALDINRKAQENAKKSYLIWLDKNMDKPELESGRASHVIGDAVHDLPFEDNTFDTVIASNFTGMSRRVEDNSLFGTSGWDYVEEANRVLKPGGKIVASWTEFILPVMSLIYLRKMKNAGFINTRMRLGSPTLSGIGVHWILTGEKEMN